MVPNPASLAAALTGAIERLLGSPEEAREMGRRGRDYVERCVSPGSVADSYEELFRSLART